MEADRHAGSSRGDTTGDGGGWCGSGHYGELGRHRRGRKRLGPSGRKGPGPASRRKGIGNRKGRKEKWWGKGNI
jgi:hypothetical protein